MLTRIVFRATLVAVLALVIVMPTIGLADEESSPGHATASQDGQKPHGERARDGRDHGRPDQGQDVTRPELRRCIEAVREHRGDRDDLRRCLAEAAGDEVTRPEVRRCIEAVHEHGGNRDDLRRCLAHAHENDGQPTTTANPPSLLERVPEPAPIPSTE
jgi:hypothetical protein